MRIALISDIHANFVALETVLADIERARVDQIVCLGDIFCNGSQPHEVIRRLQEINCPTALGNADEVVFHPSGFNPQTERDRKLVEIILWGAAQLDPSEKTLVASFPLRFHVALEGGKTMLCFHGSPKSNIDPILATTSDDELARILSDHHATVMAGGHTHTQMLRRFRDTLVINPGSVGMPITRDTSNQVHRPPWSEYAILESRGENLSVEFRRVPLDVNAVINAARTSGMPNADVWAGEWTS